MCYTVLVVTKVCERSLDHWVDATLCWRTCFGQANSCYTNEVWNQTCKTVEVSELTLYADGLERVPQDQCKICNALDLANQIPGVQELQRDIDEGQEMLTTATAALLDKIDSEKLDPIDRGLNELREAICLSVRLVATRKLMLEIETNKLVKQQRSVVTSAAVRDFSGQFYYGSRDGLDEETIGLAAPERFPDVSEFPHQVVPADGLISLEE